MKLNISFILLLGVNPFMSFGQQSTAKTWATILLDTSIAKSEIGWLKDSLTDHERQEVLSYVTNLSQPASAQLLVRYFYTDGSYIRKSIQPYIDSFSVRPPDGLAGITRIAYLSSKLNRQLSFTRSQSKIHQPDFTNQTLSVPSFTKESINRNIKFKFDFTPAETIIEILEQPDISYQTIENIIRAPQYNSLIKHHNQSFYNFPLTKEKLIENLRVAASTAPLDLLYKYINPDGLLYFTDVTNNLRNYKTLIAALKKNENNIFEYINSKIAPLLPKETEFIRSVSFFFINDADGWAEDSVTGIDLNYYKDNYSLLLQLLVHESYHSGQNAVSLHIQKNDLQNHQQFIDALDYIFMEGTATYASPPSIKEKSDFENDIVKGRNLLEKLYQNTIVDFKYKDAQKNSNDGIAGAGPFYWLGSHMAGIIAENLGNDELAKSIPYTGITFFKLYFKAIEKSKSEKNMFSDNLTNYIKNRK